MKFITPLIVRLEGRQNGRTTWRLEQALVFKVAPGELYIVPAGFITDFASVPRLPLAYWLTGGTAEKAATLHDWLCRARVMPRERADDLFYEAMLATDVAPWRAWLMHKAVRAYSIVGENLGAF